MSSPKVTSGLRLSGRYTSERNVVTSMRTPRRSHPIVPNRAPWSHTCSAHPRTRRLDRVGPRVGREVDVGRDAVEERVADAPADQVALVAGLHESRRELLHR